MQQLAAERWARRVLLVLTGLFAVLAFEFLFDVSGELRHVLNVGVYDNVMLAAGLVCIARGILRRPERAPWILVGVAVIAWAVGDTIWRFGSGWAGPSLADVGFLAFYPPAYAAILLLLRNRIDRLHSILWLDGVIAALAVAAIGTAVVFQAVLDVLNGSRAAVAVNLAYPLADLTLIALAVWGLALVRWRPGRAWGLIAAGLLVFSISDCLYLYETSTDSYVAGSATDIGWLAGGLLLAWAAWQPRTQLGVGLVGGRALFAAPVTFGLMALGVLTYDHVHRVNGLAIVLASLTIVAVILRMALTFTENMQLLAGFRTEARTDLLTGLANRRRLLDDLEAALAAPRGRMMLAIFDLNGFKQYNDSFGHLAGDALLARLGASLSRQVRQHGCAYRLGGDEFCVIWLTGHDEQLLVGARRALTEHGDGFSIEAAHGSVELPTEAATPIDALRLADQRMYAQKQQRDGRTGERLSGALLNAFAQRDAELSGDETRIGDLAAALATELGLPAEDVGCVRVAATLHDIGKMAIPDEILEKPAPLTDEELKFIRSHTVVGERILLSVPAVAHVASIVRSSHEWFDGSGYPDGLAGEQIPLASRIVFVCDAFEAMTSRRVYARLMSEDEAVDELRREAGRQFDPRVVAAFLKVLGEHPQTARVAQVAVA
jgi:two-component system, cell cycle response regulator